MGCKCLSRSQTELMSHIQNIIHIQVPKDSTTEQTILACMEELDRCFEDNGQPFFIGLISDK